MYDGKATSRLASYTGGLYSLITKDSIPARKSQEVHVYDIPYIAVVQDGGAVVDNVLTLSTSGTINELTTITKSWFRASVRNEIFSHRATTTTQWKLMGQYQW